MQDFILHLEVRESEARLLNMSLYQVKPSRSFPRSVAEKSTGHYPSAVFSRPPAQKIPSATGSGASALSR